MARPERFELPTPWFVAKYSIQLSYRRKYEIVKVFSCYEIDLASSINITGMPSFIG